MVRVSILLLALTAFDSAVSAATPTLSEAMDRLEAVADGYPPRVTPENRKEIEELWKWVEAGLREYRSSRPGPDENAEFLLGEIYRLGHNLDVDGASEKAIAHFESALEINPASSKFHLHLGRHLTFMNKAIEGQRELLLGVALDPRGAGDRPLFDLAHNCYMQKQFALAANFADRYLAIHPEEPTVKRISDVSKKVLAGGTPPKTISITKP